MIYITQLIFIHKGQEETFLEFESFALPLMAKYTGKLLYRLRPTDDSFIDLDQEKPYEIHFISFDSEEDLTAFLNDETRLDFIHLKEASVRTTLLVKGKKM